MYLVHALPLSTLHHNSNIPPKLSFYSYHSVQLLYYTRLVVLLATTLVCQVFQNGKSSPKVSIQSKSYHSSSQAFWMIYTKTYIAICQLLYECGNYQYRHLHITAIIYLSKSLSCTTVWTLKPLDSLLGMGNNAAAMGWLRQWNFRDIPPNWIAGLWLWSIVTLQTITNPA